MNYIPYNMFTFIWSTDFDQAVDHINYSGFNSIYSIKKKKKKKNTTEPITCKNLVKRELSWSV